MSHTERVIVLVDMDCFYCQVEEKLNPELEGKPIAVVQYNAWRGGGIIAVNYPARDKGVTRQMRGNDAKQKCPDIVLARVPQVRGKADLTKYRDAGKQVAEVLQNFTNLLERASIDEAYLDITEEVTKRIQQGYDQITNEKLANTFVVGYDTSDFIESLKVDSEFSESNIKLAIGGIISEEIRAEILKRTGYKCSAGVAHNKILAKLVCGLHKPNKQTILPQNTVSKLYEDLPIKKIKSLGGKFGNALAEELQISHMGELAKFGEKELCKKFDEKTAKWLYNIARGIDHDAVTVRLVSKSIGCCKRFPGKTALITSVDVEHWINELASEISERLEKDMEENNRRARQMVVSFTQETNDKESSSSRTHPLRSYEQTKIARSALDVIRRFCLRADGSYHITFLGLSVGNFQDLKNSVDISSLLKNMNNKEFCSSKPVEQDEATFFIQNLAQNTSMNLNETSHSKTVENSLKGKSANTFFQSWLSSGQEPKSDENIYAKSEVSVSNQYESSPTNVGTSNLKQNKNEDNRASTKGATKSFFINYFMNAGKHFFKKDVDIMKSTTNANSTNTMNTPLMEHHKKEVYIDKHRFTKILKITCPDCNKEISSTEYLTHLDYHFALKMVKNEAHLYNVSQCNVEQGNKKKQNKKKNSDHKKPGQPQVFFQNKIDDKNEEYNQLTEEMEQKETRVSPQKQSSFPFNNEFSSASRHELKKTNDHDKDMPTTSGDVGIDEDLFHTDSFSEKERNNNDSVYSADTEDLNEDTKNLIYFEDVFSDSDSSQPLFKNNEVQNMSSTQNVNISIKEDSTRSNTFKAPFLDFYSDQSLLNECVKENSLSGNDESMSMKQKKSDDIKLAVPEEKMLRAIEKGNSSPEEFDKKNCPECDRIIPYAEFSSHLDYHFALKLVKDEAHLYPKPAIQDKLKNGTKKSKVTQSTKRKLSDTNKIVTFLQKNKKDVLNENNSELCTECNKRIKLDETNAHADYHTAKKLHLELNVNKKLVETSVKVKNKKNKSAMNMKSISNFFKV